MRRRGAFVVRTSNGCCAGRREGAAETVPGSPPWKLRSERNAGRPCVCGDA